MGAVLLCACASAKDDKQPARPAKEIVSGAGRIRGGGVRMDVTVGAAFAQKPAVAPGTALEQGTVKP
ncbi:MAG TPA: hypothetical protein VIV40_22035 [Kofleriaceae bacterium]